MCFVCCENVYIHVICVNLTCVYVIDTELFRFCGKKSIRFYYSVRICYVDCPENDSVPMSTGPLGSE